MKKQIKDILEEAIKKNLWVRLFYGNKNTGLDWCKIEGLSGYIKKADSIQDIYLIVNDNKSTVIDDDIVKIIMDKSLVYIHDNYHLPEDFNTNDFFKGHEKFFVGELDTFNY